MSRGYDGPEIDDFRDSGWERERASSDSDSSQRGGTDWQTRASVRLKLQKVREAEAEFKRTGWSRPLNERDWAGSAGTASGTAIQRYFTRSASISRCSRNSCDMRIFERP